MTELHVFHYPTYSAIWTLTKSYTATRGERPEHLRGDGLLCREYEVFPSRAAAEAHIGDLIEAGHNLPGVIPLDIIRRTPALGSGLIAVRIEGDDNDGKPPLVGWMLYDQQGRAKRFVDGDYHGAKELVRAGVTAVSSAAIRTTVSEFMNLSAPF